MRSTTRISQDFAIGLALVVVTMGLFWPVVGHDFVNYDDDLYVTDNPRVQAGLSFGNLTWAFTTFSACNWQPLTWISHMLDVSLFEMKPGGHHFMSLLLHAVNTLLLFGVLKQLTGARWPSLLVAALFGWHPLHIESVAWVAERKDVLSTLFLFLALGSYGRYARGGGRKDYSLALLWFAFGLMAKPMLVTLPFVLLLLDYWPLRRMSGDGAAGGQRVSWAMVRGLILEKTPFFALTLASCVLTMIAQKSGGAMQPAENLPFHVRAINAVVACAAYLWKMVWPSDLAVLYPYQTAWPAGVVVGSVLALIVVTMVVLWRRDQPFLAVGWLWFLGTLVPVLGLVQVGVQSMADRYTYVPLIGVFIMLAWAAARVAGKSAVAQRVFVPLACIVMAACTVRTGLHLVTWKNGVALFEHTVRVTKNNALAHNNLAFALNREGKVAEAINHYQEAVRIKPDFGLPHYNLAFNLVSEGRIDEALTHWSHAVRARVILDEDFNAFGVALASHGHLEQAAGQFKEALRRDSKSARAHHNLGLAFTALGLADEAVQHFRQALRLEPAWADPMQALAWILSTHDNARVRDGREAVRLAERLCELTGNGSPAYLETLAAAYAEAGRFDDAVVAARRAVALADGAGRKELAVRITARLKLFEAGKPCREAPEKPTSRTHARAGESSATEIRRGEVPADALAGRVIGQRIHA